MIVVSELASNILKYGIRGEIVFRRITDESGRPGIEIAASDVGPQIQGLRECPARRLDGRCADRPD